MLKDVTLVVRTTAVEKIALAQLAKQRDRNPSETVRAILRQAIDEADEAGKISLAEIRQELEGEDLPDARRAWRGG